MNKGKYSIEKSEDGRFYFNLLAKNGLTLGSSRLVTTVDEAKRVANDAQKYLADGANYREDEFDENTGYGFSVRDRDFHLVFRTTGYSRRTHRSEAIRRCIKYAGSPIQIGTSCKFD